MAKKTEQDKQQGQRDAAEYRKTMTALRAEQARLEKAGKTKPSSVWHKHNNRAAQLEKKVPWWKR